MTERQRMESALREGLPGLGLRLSQAQIQSLLDFGAAVLAQNQVMNLTAVKEPEAFARLHLLDSLSLLTAADLEGKTRDLVSGAGFPGVPLKIACPSIKLTLLDSTEKKIPWLSRTLPTLGIEAQAVCARAEAYEPRFDVVTSRAVAAESTVRAMPAPGQSRRLVLRPQGSGRRARGQQASGAIKKLGGTLRKITPLTLPGGERRVILSIEQTSPCPAGYPRSWGQMKKRPLN